MKDFRFTGVLQGNLIDARFRTDAINATDQNFTVMQIQVGTQFNTMEKNSDLYKKYMGIFQELPYTLTAFINFATVNNMKLGVQDSNGSNHVVIYNPHQSVSTSI